MCGICGIFEPGREQAIQLCVLKKMADTISHRGPDDEGFYSSGEVGLAHRRLAIIDLSGGHQPLANEDDTVWIVFNGEIYNFDELNRRFLSNGHRFRTRSDTETIVHLYEELGEACFAELRGMFAIALWDARRKRLLLARDPIGKKPIYYAWDGKRLVFGSEIKSVLAAGGSAPELDPEALSDYFSYQYIPTPKTIYKNIRKLRPAHYLANDVPKRVDYWVAEAPGAAGEFVPNHEADQVAWVAADGVRGRMTYQRDADTIAEFLSGARRTTPFIVLRHASAGTKSAWEGDESARPLDTEGERDASALAGLLR